MTFAARATVKKWDTGRPASVVGDVARLLDRQPIFGLRFAFWDGPHLQSNMRCEVANFYPDFSIRKRFIINQTSTQYTLPVRLLKVQNAQPGISAANRSNYQRESALRCQYRVG